MGYISKRFLAIFYIDKECLAPKNHFWQFYLVKDVKSFCLNIMGIKKF